MKISIHKVKKYVPNLVRRWRVVQHSPYENIYYCCTQKTASQWFKAVFSDQTVYKYTGLDVFPFSQIPMRMQDAHFKGRIPRYNIGTHFYIDYETYLDIPKPTRYKTFFVLRDPRDVVVSWYFSVQASHKVIGLIQGHRSLLDRLDLEAGLRHSINHLKAYGLFDAQRSWVEAPKSNEDLKIFRYEDFARDNSSFLQKLFGYLGISMPKEEFEALCERHKFKEYSGGRNRGEEDSSSHYRKGTSGDWENYFTDSTIEYFDTVTGDILDILGYQ